MAIISYALDQEEPELKGVPLSIFILIRPTLDAGRKKAKNRMNKSKTKQEQNSKEKEREVEGEIEGECEIECENECYPPNPLVGGSKAVKYYLDRINATPSRTCIDELLGYEKTLGTEICLKAMDVALDDKKTAWSYIRAILQDKAARGIRTLADWQADEDKRRADKAIVNPKTAGSTPGHAPTPERDERAKASMERLRKQLREEAGT